VDPVSRATDDFCSQAQELLIPPDLKDVLGLLRILAG
jgi:hypothetical protein